MQRIIDVACEVYGVAPDDLLDPKNNVEPAFSARVALATTLHRLGESVAIISRRFMMPSAAYTEFLLRRHYDMVQRPEGNYRDRYCIMEMLELEAMI